MNYLHGQIVARGFRALYRFGMAMTSAHRNESRQKNVRNEACNYILVPMSDDEKVAYHMSIMHAQACEELPSTKE